MAETESTRERLVRELLAATQGLAIARDRRLRALADRLRAYGSQEVTAHELAERNASVGSAEAARDDAEDAVIRAGRALLAHETGLAPRLEVVR